jgi:hypothetical protein
MPRVREHPQESIAVTGPRSGAESVGSSFRFTGPEAGPGAIRRILLVLVLLGMAGLALELFLLEHMESAWQWLPLVVLAMGFASASAAAVRPTRRTVRLLQAIMALFVATGLLGLYLHLQGNAEFELEMDASARGLDLLWRSLRGATPALAPGALAHLGLLGLAYGWRHPALRRGAGDPPA